MTPENKILRDLIAGQSTADSTAGRLGIVPQAAQVIMDRLVASGSLEVLTVAEKLRVNRLTPETRQAIADADRSTQTTESVIFA